MFFQGVVTPGLYSIVTCLLCTVYMLKCSFLEQIEIKEVTFLGLLQFIPICNVLQQLETVVQDVYESFRKLQTRRKR